MGSNLPLRGQKAQLYEGGVRTPTVISWPGVLEPCKLDHPMHIVDWMPTFTNLIGYTPAENPQWDGIDVWPLISGAEHKAKERSIFWNFKGNRFGLRQGDWKLIMNDDEKPENSELYNIATDPHETQDLAKDKPDITSEMLNGIQQERKLDGISERNDVK